MTKLKKFLFDVDFTKNEIEENKPTENEPTLDPNQIPIFSRTEVDNYKNQHEKIGFEKGFKKGNEEALDNINNNLLDIFNKFKNELNTFEEMYEKKILDIRKSSANISLEIAKKLCSSIKDIHPQHNVSSFLKEINKRYSDILSSKKIKIYINDKILEAVKLYINENSELFNKNQNFELVEDKELDINDCRFEWESGGIEKKFKDIEQEVNKRIEDYIFSIEKDFQLKILKEVKHSSAETNDKILEDENKNTNNEKKNTEQQEKLEKKEDSRNDGIKTVGGSKSVKYE